MTHQQPQPGLVDLMDYLHDAGVRRALCTRNFECEPLFFSLIFLSLDSVQKRQNE